MNPASDRKFFLGACLLLALGTAALYWPATQFPFINFDDGDYVYENPVTQAGLTAHGFVWAFNGIHVGNWHPLTWLSHQLDCQLFGRNAGGHHLVNILFHIANSLLLFVFLRSATGFAWRSAAVAALFAWHPLHVESVAWVAERKDVLSAFFWLLTMLAYARYAGVQNHASSPRPSPPSGVEREQATACESAQPVARHRAAFYLLALLCSALALLSKPMAVTLPFTLLLLDLWPLRRISDFQFSISNLRWLVVEKIPFFALSFALCTVTFLVQRSAGAVSPVELSSRLGNVPVAYARYLSKLFWPADLSIAYPFIYHWPWPAILGSVMLLMFVSLLALALLRNRPWLPAGWFWFLGTLVPVIGFVQVGAQSMADRYSYVPSIGLLVAVIWAAAEWGAGRTNGKIILAIAGGGALAGCVLLTSAQLTYWRSTSSLFLHALTVTQNNYVAENTLGKEYEAQGDLPRAAALYQDAVRIEPRFATSQYNYGLALIGLGRKEEAFEHLATAASLDPRNADAQFNLGIFFLQNGSWSNAVPCFEATLKLRPDSAMAHERLGEALMKLGQNREAAAHFHEALRQQPDFAEATRHLAELAPPTP